MHFLCVNMRMDIWLDIHRSRVFVSMNICVMPTIGCGYSLIVAMIPDSAGALRGLQWSQLGAEVPRGSVQGCVCARVCALVQGRCGASLDGVS